MRIDYQAEGYDEIEDALQRFGDENREEWVKEGLVRSSEVVEQAAGMLPRPRSKDPYDTYRKYKGYRKPGHILDFVTHKDPGMIGVTLGIETGVNMDGGYKKSQRGFGYANILEDNQPFLLSTAERTTEIQLNAFMGALREGLGLL